MAEKTPSKLSEMTRLSREGKAFIFITALCSTIVSLVVPLSILVLFEKIIPNQSTDSLIALYMIILFSLLLDFVLKRVEDKFITIQASRSGSELLQRIYESFLKSSKARFKKKKYGVYMEEVRGIEQSLNSLLTENAKISATATSGVVMLLVIAAIEPVTGLLLVASSIVTYLLTRRFKVVRSNTLVRQSDAEGQANTTIIDIVTAPYRIKSSSMEFRAERFVAPKLDSREYYGALSEELSSRVNSHIALINQLSLFAVVSVAATRVIQGEISQGVMAAIILLVNRYFSFLQQLITFDQTKSLNRQVSKSINSIFDLVEEKSDKLVIDKIDTLSIASEVIQRGQVVFLTGRSGSGKSVVQRIISQEMSTDDSRVLVNNISMADIAPGFANRFVTRVQKGGQYIDGTVIDNLTCFEPSRHNLCYYLADALKIRDTLDQLPKGFYTEINRTQRLPFSKKVTYLSLVIRATLFEPEILLLDDADVYLNKSDIERLAVTLANQRRNQYTIIATKHSMTGELFSTIKLERD